MVAIKSILSLAFVAFVAAAPQAQSEETADLDRRILGLNILPTFSGKNFEYSLHSSATGKHLGSCHIYLQDDDEPIYPKDGSYKCNVKTRFCKANGPGAKQAFINNCNIVALGSLALFVSVFKSKPGGSSTKCFNFH